MPQQSDVKATQETAAPILNLERAERNLSVDQLEEQVIVHGEGALCDLGAVMVDTGQFTGRSPADRFLVKDETTKDRVNWGDINQAITPKQFDQLHRDMLQAMEQEETLYCQDGAVGADSNFRRHVRVITPLAWQALFVHNMFLNPTEQECDPVVTADFRIYVLPDFKADRERHGAKNSNITAIDLSRGIILIAGSGYSGEIKKGVFSSMNYLLPQQGVLPMHCSANTTADGKHSALFFGLSGTGKTTLSTTGNRKLIGDDEHGWSDNGIFNFEGGCYAKTAHLDPEKEPDIYHAIKKGAVVENMRLIPDTKSLDFDNLSITQNTRVSYPLEYIKDRVESAAGPHPNHVIFLTCDAFGVLPPIQRLTLPQAMYHFISGYTAKIAGTEDGIDEPQAVFSACFGAPFMPLNPVEYAKMLGQRLKSTDTDVWLINTGWTGGPHGVGHRIDLVHTRRMLLAALGGELDNVEMRTDPIFKTEVPLKCFGVPESLLNPRTTWDDSGEYDQKATKLAHDFHANFTQYRDFTNGEIIEGAPEA